MARLIKEYISLLSAEEKMRPINFGSLRRRLKPTDVTRE